MLRRLLLALALLAAPAAAQTVPAPTDGASTSTVTAPAVRAEPAPNATAVVADTGRVAVPEPSAKALAYFRGNTVLWAVGILWGLLIPALALFTGFSARLRALAKRVGRKWYFTVTLYGMAAVFLSWLVGLPLAWYETFHREHAYGLSNQTLGKWMSDSVTGLILSLVGVALLLWLPYLMLRKSPRRWWLWTGLGAVPLMVFTIFITPLWIDPLFNRFGPMQDQRLEARILSLAERAGIEGGRVYEVEKSVDTEAVNAYVTGFGGSKRIVLWDTILRKLDERELLFVMGHEMGHFVLHHVIFGLAIAALSILFALYAVHRLSGWFIARWKDRFGFDRMDDVASLPLLALIVSLVSLVITPVPLAYSRWAEKEADRFGLELTRDNHHAATAFVRLQSENLAVPYHSTLYKLWHDSHPPIGERIDFINDYRPWEEGKPLKYADRFESATPPE